MTELKGRKLEVAKLLQRKTGATVEQICKKTKMQAHSARAFLSRMPMTIVKSKIGDKPMVYKIEEVAAA